MAKMSVREILSASLRGAIVPFLSSSGSGSGSNFNVIGNLFGKQDPTPIKTPQDAYDRYLGWVMAAVSMIAFDVRTNPFHVWDRRGTDDREKWKEIPPSEYPGAFNRPNLNLTFRDLIEVNQMSLDLTGEGFFHLIKSPAGKLDGIQFLCTEWVTGFNPNETGTQIESWNIQAPGVNGNKIIPSNELIQFKYPNPKDPVRGSSPLSGAAISADIDTFSRNYVGGFFSNGGMPLVAIQTNAPTLTTEQRDGVIETFMDRYSQGNNKPGVLAKGADIKEIGWPLKDMDLEAITRFSREQIFAIYGIPAAKFGIKDAGGMSEDTAGYEYSYQKNSLKPRLLRLQEEINLKQGVEGKSLMALMFPGRDVYFEEEDPVQEDVKLKKEIAEAKFTRGVTTINEYRVEMGDTPVEGDDGDVYLIPTTVIRIQSGELNLIPEVQALSMKLNEAETKSIQLTQLSGTYRMQLAQLEFLRGQEAQERTFKSKIRQRFSQEQKMVIAAYDAEFHGKSLEQIMSIGEITFKNEDEMIVTCKEYGFTGGILQPPNVEAWTAIENPTVRLALATGVTLVADELDKEATLSTEQMAIRANKIASERVLLVTSDTYQEINFLVDRGLKTGASTNEIRDSILSKYDDWKGYRAERIARTETANSVNTGKQWGAENISKEYGIKPKKQWIAALMNTRDSHVTANGQKRDYDKPFNVGGHEMMNPGAYGAPAAETINCQCTVTYSVLK